MFVRRGQLWQRRLLKQDEFVSISRCTVAQVAGFKALSHGRYQTTAVAVEHDQQTNDASFNHDSQPFLRKTKNQNLSSNAAFRPSSQQSSSLPASEPWHHNDIETPTVPPNSVQKALRLYELVEAYRSLGHAKARLDPLEMRGLCDGIGSGLSGELKLQNYGLTEADLNVDFPLGHQILPQMYENGIKSMKLKDILNTYERAYCGTYAIEFQHIHERNKRAWIRDRVELDRPFAYSKEEQKQILDRLIWASNFEQFLTMKFPNEKRYGLAGGESFLSGIKALVDTSVEHGVENIVIGSQHRGRLSLLANLTRKPLEEIFQEFSLGSYQSHQSESGDVKTHLGMTYERTCPSGKKVKISLLANPSHLEADDPVAAGKAKALQELTNDKNHSKTMCLTLHGDAAVAGQGVVYETLTLSRPPAFNTGGTIHVIVNNQIGFTTDPVYSRSSMYCSDIAKTINAPIFHVNADDVEAVTFVSKLAADWRAKFKSDIFIDLVCYRKFGHNEMDQPMFTQPVMYERIAKKKSVLDIYVEKLVESGRFTQMEINTHKSDIWDQMTARFEASKEYQRQNIEWTTTAWPSIRSLAELAEMTTPAQNTAIDENTYAQIATGISHIPENVSIHRNVNKVLRAREQSLEKGSSIDWSTAEALAFGSLLLEGTHVRVSGQDVERGTFSQRHAVVHNQQYVPGTNTIQKWVPLDHLSKTQARFTICNSPLSEYGVLGFEYGYSLESPNALVQWEAQFGDFANNAQVIIDQYLAGGEAKWLQRSGLVLSLPHGYDGQGAEHSSARLERFLQLCNEDSRRFPTSDQLARQHQDCNFQVVYITTPANLFHVLRRQIHREFRKPLVIFFSKSLLRHPLTRSPRKDFLEGSTFQQVITDSEHGKSVAPPEKIRKVLLCSGQVYAALLKHRKELNRSDVAITRIEQLHPFPWQQIKENLDTYTNATEVVWCQEEPMNGGAWQFAQARLDTVLKQSKHHKNKSVGYVGRDPSAATATGFKSVHDVQATQLMKDAFAI